MIPISSAISGGLAWSRKGSGYELKLNHEVVGRLHKTNFWSSDYRAESSHGNWKFVRCGRLGNGAEIRDENNVCAATFKTGWSGPGTFKFADGQTFLVSSEGCWRPVWKVTTLDGQPVLQVGSREKAVTLEKPLAKQSDLTQSRWLLLILFTFYRMRQAEEDGAVAAMVAAIG